MNVYFYTLGCKVNQYETQEMGEILERAGYTIIYSVFLPQFAHKKDGESTPSLLYYTFYTKTLCISTIYRIVPTPILNRLFLFHT